MLVFLKFIYSQVGTDLSSNSLQYTGRSIGFINWKGFLFISRMLFALTAIEQTYGQNGITGDDWLNHGIGKYNWQINPFEQKVFIENKGQFNTDSGAKGSAVKFGIRDAGMDMYFTPYGITYKHDEYRVFNEDEIVSAARANPDNTNTEREERSKRTEIISHFLRMNWVGANPDAQVIAEEPVSHYFTYPDMSDKTVKTCITAFACKKIIYKNLYPSIDVEYFFPVNKPGIEYSLILHPGADAGVIKMQYSGMEGISLDAEGNLQIETSSGITIDHAPVSYCKDGTPVNSGFSLKGDVVSFSFTLSEDQKTKSETQNMIIDPWTVNPSFTGYNAAYDVNYDLQGNVYVYGGGYPWQEMKFDNMGNKIWTYTASSLYATGCTGGPCYGDFAVDASSGSSYIVEAFNGGAGTHVIKLNSSGIQIGIYNPPNNNLSEMWRVQFNNCTKQAIIAGGGISQTYQACLLDTNVSSMTPVNVLNASSPYHDFSLLALDNSGNCFMATNEKVTEPGVLDNILIKCPAGTLAPVVYTVNDNHLFREVSNISYVEGVTSETNGFNGIAVDNNYIYTYDGNLLQKWNKSTGTLKKAVTMGTSVFSFGGIDVNTCGDIFIGNQSSILQLDSNLSTVATINLSGTVFDIRMGADNLIYAAGSGFVSSITITSASCSALNLSDTATAASCNMGGTATVTAKSGVGPYSYSWSPTGQTTQTASGLAAGTYSVTVLDNGYSPCSTISGRSQTVTIVVPRDSTGLTVTLSPSDTAIACTSGSSVQLTAGGGSTYSWSPPAGLSAFNIANPIATPATATTYTVTITGANKYGSTCTAAKTVAVTFNKPAIYSSDAVICSGTSTTLNVNGSSTSYSWSPSTGLSSSTGSSVTANPVSSTTYTITGTNAFGCTSTTALTVTINPGPTLITSGNVSICNGSSALLTVGGASSYIWTGSTGVSGSTANSVTVNPTTATTYTVYGASSNGCTSSATINVNIITPITTISSGGVICKGGSTTLSASGGVSYSWGCTPSTACGLSSNTGSPVTVTPTNTGLMMYTVTATDVNGCTASATDTVTVFSLPVFTPSITLKNDSLFASPYLSTLFYQWYKNSVVIVGATNDTLALGIDTVGIFTVDITNANGCGKTANRVLPVELVSFDAVYNGKTVDLVWSTAREINNDYFTVERTKDGIDFSFIVNIKGAGTSNSLLSYHATDENPLQGISAYRLKQTDFDGRFTYSNLVAVEVQSKNKLAIIALSSIGDDHLLHYVLSTSSPGKSFNFEISNLIGNVIASKVSTENIGIIDFSGFAHGIYLFRVFDGDKSLVRKFVY